jgi:LPXTG-motif cell wall-anchored protein
VITADDVTYDGDTYTIALTKDNTGLPGDIDVVDASTTEPGELTYANNVISFTPASEAEGRVTIDYLAKNGAGRFASGRIRFALETTTQAEAALPTTGNGAPWMLALLGVALATTGGLVAIRRRAQ